jgi:D-glycero-D-manno-heptose 1,7-bisphosphate phosphatase
MTRKAVFLDRDGTLIVDQAYLHKPSQVEILPGVIPALRAIQSAGYLLIIISNQSGVGRGYFTLEEVDKVNHHLGNLLNKHGIKISGTYYCPHRPNEQCSCRKPEPGMVIQAIKEYKIDASHSYLVGDKWTDVEAAIAAGVEPVWLTKEFNDVNKHPRSITVTNSLLSWTKLMNLEVCDDTHS